MGLTPTNKCLAVEHGRGRFVEWVQFCVRRSVCHRKHHAFCWAALVTNFTLSMRYASDRWTSTFDIDVKWNLVCRFGFLFPHTIFFCFFSTVGRILRCISLDSIYGAPYQYQRVRFASAQSFVAHARKSSGRAMYFLGGIYLVSLFLSVITSAHLICFGCSDLAEPWLDRVASARISYDVPMEIL